MIRRMVSNKVSASDVKSCAAGGPFGRSRDTQLTDSIGWSFKVSLFATRASTGGSETLSVLKNISTP